MGMGAIHGTGATKRAEFGNRTKIWLIPPHYIPTWQYGSILPLHLRGPIICMPPVLCYFLHSNLLYNKTGDLFSPPPPPQ